VPAGVGCRSCSRHAQFLLDTRQRTSLKLRPSMILMPEAEARVETKATCGQYNSRELPDRSTPQTRATPLGPLVFSSHQHINIDDSGSHRYSRFPALLLTGCYGVSDAGNHNSDVTATLWYSSFDAFSGLPIWEVPTESKQCE
jgi:hypothetical protein